MLLDNTHIKSLKYCISILFIILILPELCLAQQSILLDRQVVLMGSEFQISIVDTDSIQANKHIETAIQEIERIENLISEWRTYTQVSQVNKYAGIKPIKVDKELFDLTARALEYSKISNGAFDISIAAMDRIWKFDGSMNSLPDSISIEKSIENVGYQYIQLDSIQSTIFLTKKGMKIGFGSIGKGYAADKTKDLLQKQGVKAGMINASGDIATWGTLPQGKPWKIGVNNPFKRRAIAKILHLKNKAVATSGSYEKFAEIHGIRYSHIINPKTGFPSQGLTSVTITGPSTEFANFISTTMMVLGKKEGIKLIKKFPLYEYLLITDDGKVINN